MNRGIYSTATGMQAAQRWMDVTANNLANVSTPGFKRDGLTFNDFMIRNLAADGGRGPQIGSLGSGAAPRGEFTDTSIGNLQKTGNALDLAIPTQEGMFAIQTPTGIRYTRDGEFTLDSGNRVVNRDGNALLDENNNEIVLTGNGPITVSRDGQLSEAERPVARIGLWRGNFQKAGSNDYEIANPVAVAAPQIQQGALEASNAEPIQAMVDMIRFGRFYELSQRSIQTQDEMTGKVLEVLKN